MKKVLLSYLVFSIIVGFFGCKKIDKLTQFNIDFQDKIVIASTAGINTPFNIVTPDKETNSKLTFENNNTRADLIQEITLSKADMVLDIPKDKTFRFLKSIAIFIKAEGLPEIEIASKNDIPNTVGNQLILDVSGADFKEYIKKDKFDIRVNTVTDEVTSQDYEITLSTTYFVNAKVLGI